MDKCRYYNVCGDSAHLCTTGHALSSCDTYSYLVTTENIRLKKILENNNLPSECDLIDIKYAHIWYKFLSEDISFKVNSKDIESFTGTCDKYDLFWQHGVKASAFNPFLFYEGDKIKYIIPLQNIKDANYIYVKVRDGKLYFGYCNIEYDGITDYIPNIGDAAK